MENGARWPANYFNYFTEVEDHFQRARGTGLFLLSPLDWALIENWKNGGIPLEAVLQGIETAFEKWRGRKSKFRQVNSLAYCTQAVIEAAQRASSRSRQENSGQSPFSEEEVRSHLTRCSAAVRNRPEEVFQEIALALQGLAANVAEHLANAEDLERRLTSLEDKMVGAARSLQSDDQLYLIRESLDNELRPYRSKMTADQLAMLERRYLDTAVLDRSNLPRLSLFYLQ